MNIEFTPKGWEDFEYWIQNDESVTVKIRNLIKSIKQTPFNGLGKPEPLKYNLKGFWSRRITGEHRLVYQITGTKGLNQKCIIVQCRFHYDE
ncbi:MAG: Txe/YoeB family addiction module toxin [Sphingobacteriales bacterium]|nr:MAG: Txe/YoeB family addiction module toxin [Sphingobacteriales bacterium]TAF83146.1 MAG: Txe/YoeB family addiction module toxin [Sphingobacteriales bacterium]